MRWIAALPLLATSVLAQAPGKATQSAAAVKELQAGLKAKTAFERLQAIKKAAKLDTDPIAKALAKSLRDKENSVRKAAVRALRYMKAPTAFKELLKAAKLFEKDEDIGPDYYLALGQKGDVKALPTLMHRAWNPASAKIFQARIKATAHIRSPASIQELIKLNNKFRPAGRRINKRGPTGPRRQITQALELLTSQSAPQKGEEWRAWMLKIKKVTKVAAEPKGLTQRELAAYKQTWQQPLGDEERPDRKRDRRNKKRNK